MKKEMLSKKICILGASGFIGGNLLRYFNKNGFKVSGLSRSKSKLFGNDLNDLIFVHEINKLDFKLEEFLKDADIVVDCAAHLNPYNLGAYSLNDLLASCTSQLNSKLETVERLNVEKYIYISSGGAVYGLSSFQCKETTLPRPMSKYGLIKSIEESMICFFDQHSSVDFNIVRVSNPYGPYHSLTKQQGVVNIFIRKALLHQQIELWGDPDKSIKDYIYIDALCDAIAQLCTKSSTELIYNLGSSTLTKLSEILFAIEEECGFPLRRKYMNQNPQDTSIFCLDTLNFEKNVGKIQKFSLREGVSRTIEWYDSVLNHTN